jgi:hypothetical protein
MRTSPLSQCLRQSYDTFFRRSKATKLSHSPTVVAWHLDDVPCAKQPFRDYSTGAKSARGRRWPPPAPLGSSPSETPCSNAPYTWTSVFCDPYPSGNPRRPGDFWSPWTRISQFRRVGAVWPPPKVPRNSGEVIYAFPSSDVDLYKNGNSRSVST